MFREEDGTIHVESIDIRLDAPKEERARIIAGLEELVAELKKRQQTPSQ